MQIRPIEQEDNPKLAALIRQVFREFKIDKPGTVYTDPTTDRLYELFQTPNSYYWIATENNNLLGGCGIFPTAGLPAGCAELVKSYLAPEARGKKIGKQLLEKSIQLAIDFGYQQLYLESFPELSKAISIYEKAGFKQLTHSLGNSGHYACTLWMLKDLQKI